VPIFSYECKPCNSQFEKLVRIMDKPVECPKCGQPAEQVWSTPSPMVWGRGGRGF
jgi:putative FmdB family regulatory protein